MSEAVAVKRPKAVTRAEISERARLLIQNGVCDPDKIADRLARELTGGLGELIHHALREIARMTIHQMRGSNVRAACKSARHKMVADIGLKVPWYVPATEAWTALGKMTANDCDSLADSLFGLAESHREQGKKFRRLAERMRSRGDSTVADLGANRVTLIMGTGGAE